MRFGSPSLKSKLLAWYYAHLSLPFNKVGCGSVVPSLKSKLLAWYYAHLSLPLYTNQFDCIVRNFTKNQPK
ncbi:unknown [Prevotella sp. CAG:891]|nr:unknown [Prevotella sp. CAG:891]